MTNKRTATIAAFIALALALPCAVFAEGEGIALGQAVELTGAALPQQIRDITGIGTGASSWDYLSQKITYGYFVEVYSHFDALAKAKVDKRNGVEDLIISSYKTDNNANIAIADVKFNQDYSQHVMVTEFAQLAARGTQITNTYTMNTYIPHSDGSVDFFQDGLLARVDNQRSVDEVGNVSFKNLYNFVYDQGRRLMMSHEYDRTDHMGNKTHGTFSCTYTGDSVFYGTDQTNANKNYASYTTTETDHTGRPITTTWTPGTYEGKYLRDFTQTTVDAIPGKETGTSTLHRYNIQYSAPGQMVSYYEDGVMVHVEGEDGTDVDKTYTLSRSNITYGSRGQITGYDDIRREMGADGNTDVSTWTTTTSHVTIEYIDTPNQFGNDVEPEASRIKKQTVASKIENTDGSYRNETSVIEYNYDANYKLVGVSGTSTFNGLSSDWIAYADNDGRLLVKTAKRDDKGNMVKDSEGNVIYEYSYLNDNGEFEVVIESSNETSEAFRAAVNSTPMRGNMYNGTSENTYEIFCGVPVIARTDSTVQNLGADNQTVVSVVDTTTANTYGLVNNMVKLLKTVDTSVSTQPALDANGEYATKKTVTTTYTYNNNGYLDKVEGKGTSNGFDYSEETGFNNPFTSDITVTYMIKFDKPLEIRNYEKFTYNNTEGDDTNLIDMTPYTTSEALMAKAWEYYTAKDMSKATQFLSETKNRYSEQAAEQQAGLSGFAPDGKESQYWALNDVGTAEFLLGKIALAASSTSAAKAHFENVINNYGFAQCWDTKGWYWHVAEAAQIDLDTINAR